MATLAAGVILAPLPAAGSEDTGERLRRLRREAATLTRENLALGQEERKILGQLDELAARRDVAAAELAAARTAVAEVSRTAASWEQEEARALRQERRARQGLATRLRQMERLGPAAPVAALAAAPSPAAAMTGLRALTDAAALDRQLAATARRSREEATAAAAATVAARLELETATVQARDSEAEAAAAAKRHQARLNEIRAESSLYSQAAAEMTEAAARLQAFLGGSVASTPAGPDPLRLRGTLPWPTAGSILQGFGPRRHPRFGTLVPHNGIAIAAAAGADVRAMADGTVAFADWFQGYGRTVIIDHGGGLMTVQSHLSAVIVSPGQGVSQGQLLGLVGDSGSMEGVRLYFEIRRLGVPEDPEGWLRRAPEA